MCLSKVLLRGCFVLCFGLVFSFLLFLVLFCENKNLRITSKSTFVIAEIVGLRMFCLGFTQFEINP